MQTQRIVSQGQPNTFLTTQTLPNQIRQETSRYQEVPGQQFQNSQQFQPTTVSGMYQQSQNQYKQLVTTNQSSTYIPHVHQYVKSQQQEIIKPIQQQELKTMHEVHHYERPLQVVSIDEMESKWKSKCFHLEYVVYELQVEIQKLRQGAGQGTVQVVQDDTLINELKTVNKSLRDKEIELKNEIKRLLDEIEQWKMRYKKLEDLYSTSQGNDEQIRQLNITITNLRNELDDAEGRLKKKDSEFLNLRQLLNDRDAEINDLYNRLQDMESRMESINQSETTIITLQGEVEVWKKKFRDKNSESADLSEKLMMAETELDAIKKRQVTVIKDQVVTKTTNQTSSSNNVRGSMARPSGVYNKQL